jgi:hypothetical protein
MQIVAIMQEMGWTYNEYMNNPKFYIDLLKDKLEIDGKNQQKQSFEKRK